MKERGREEREGRMETKTKGGMKKNRGIEKRLGK